MNQGKKVCWVADNIHGTIPLSRLEKILISTPEYNRLHNVLQNSTVYLTYPANRTSRFIHSIGCAHVAGQMFKSSIENATDDCLSSFWRELQTQLDSLVASTAFKEDTAALDLKSPAKKLKELKLPTGLIDPFYAPQMPSRLTKETERCCFVLLCQAVRFAALLHDIGHPPFSHVTEHALGRIFEDLEDRKDSLSKIELELLNKFQSVRTKDETNQSQPASASPAFHELLGIGLSNRLLQDVIRTAFFGHGTVGGIASLYPLYLKHVTLGILRDDNPFFRSLHSLVAGDIDADRIDYVLRDSVASGYQNGTMQIERLLNSFHLVAVNKADTLKGIDKARRGSRKQISRFEFLPSLQSVGVLEDLFRRRLNLYRQVVFHHRAVKLNALMEQCIFQLAKEHLADGKEKRKAKRESVVHDFLLRPVISGLWHVLDKDVDVFSSERTNCYIQWDDSWILSTLRRRLMEFEASPPKVAEEQNFHAKLQELLANKKSYFALFKRTDGYREVERAFVAAFPNTFEWLIFENQLPSPSPAKLYLPELQDLIRKWNLTKNNDELEMGSGAKGGFPLGILSRILKMAAIPELRWVDLVTEALVKLQKSEGFLDAFLVEKALKPGLKGTQQLVSRTGLVALGSVSSIPSILEDESHFFPPFFLFFRNNSNGISEMEMMKLRAKFGELLCGVFCKKASDLSQNPQLGLELDPSNVGQLPTEYSNAHLQDAVSQGLDKQTH